jgi:hypothetical protein
VPSKGELSVLYKNVSTCTELGPRWHWSSTDYPGVVGWAQSFSCGPPLKLIGAQSLRFGLRHESLRCVRG